MCGIAAIFSKSATNLAEDIGQMTNAIRHRGPDGEGFLLLEPQAARPVGGPDTPRETFSSSLPYAPKGNLSEFRGGAFAAFGHRRLAIVDLSPTGHQPMSTSDQQLWIVYNGEIYNFIELRKELESLGHAFVSTSDTEVILKAYRQWGAKCLHRFNGMFSFVMYDRSTDKVFAARDRFGVKPLYYWAQPGKSVAFASEIKQFAALPGWSAKINAQRAYDFLSWRIFDHTSETMFRGVFQLRGGEYIESTLGELIHHPLPQRWYRLKARPFSGSFDDAATEFRSMFTDAVRLRLRSDVPVGSCLSGGMDSSAIVCTANELLRSTPEAKSLGVRQNTFSACSELKKYDEREYIEEIVAKTGVASHYTFPSLESLFETIGKIAWHQDEPVTSSGMHAQWKVFELAAQHNIKVMLDGQGSDEYLAGYQAFWPALCADLAWSLKFREFFAEFSLFQERFRLSRVGALKKLGFASMPVTARRLLRRRGMEGVFAPDWLNCSRLGAEAEDPFLRDPIGEPRDVLSMSKSLLLTRHLPMLLHYEDRNSMAHSIESRVPFLDYRLVEFTLGLPDRYKLQGGTTKRVLREALKGQIPDVVRNRKDKMAFETAEEIWMREHSPAQFRGLLRNSVDSSNGIIHGSILDAFDEFVAGKRPFSLLFWRVINFGVWMNQFQVKV